MTTNFDRLLERIHAKLVPKDRPLVIGVSGFGGSGKSTLAARLAGALGSVNVVCMDDFWDHARDGRSSDWDAFDRSRLEAQVLRPARAGGLVRYQAYDWVLRELGAWVDVPGGQYLIVEGISALHATLLPYYDLTVWVDVPLELARERGLARGYAWGNDETEVWTSRWMPNDRDYFDKHRPDRQADVVYPNAEVVS